MLAFDTCLGDGMHSEQVIGISCSTGGPIACKCYVPSALVHMLLLRKNTLSHTENQARTY